MGEKTFTGGSGYCYFWDLTKEKQPVRYHLYLGKKDYLPVMLSEERRYRDNKWRETFREYYSDWKTDQKIDESKYQTVSPPPQK